MCHVARWPGGCYLWRKQLLYSCAHCADCELCLVGHDVGGLNVAVIHWVLERSSSISVLMAHVTIEGDFGSSSEMKQVNVNSSVHIGDGQSSLSSIKQRYVS